METVFAHRLLVISVSWRPDISSIFPIILAAVGLAQLRKCDTFRRKRRSVAELYRNKLADSKNWSYRPVGPTARSTPGTCLLFG